MKIIALTLGYALIAAAQPASDPSITGRWKSPGGNSIIDIAACGDQLCGSVAWASARAKQDSAKATDQLVGTQLLTGLSPAGAGRWQGRLFIPDKNLRVTAKITVTAAGQLKVSGCIAGKSICKSSLWTRADGPLPASD